MILSPSNLEGYAKKNKIDYKKSDFLSSCAIKQDNEGNLILGKSDYCNSGIDTKKHNYCKKWIALKNWSLALIKQRIPDKEKYNSYSENEKEVLIANNFLMPIIAGFFQVESAEYYNVKFDNKKDKDVNPWQIYLLTPSFLEKNEELIHLANIVGESENRATIMLAKIEEWLRLRKYPETDISRVKMDFIKQTIFNRYIDFSDEHNLNSGIVITHNSSGINRVRMAPVYDIDYSAGVYNLNDRFPIIKMRAANNGGTDLESMIIQFKDLPWMKQYLKEVISSIDIEKALAQAKATGNLKLSELAVRRYTNFFKAQNRELTQTYELVYGKELEDR